MNKGLLSVAEALAVLLEQARPVAGIEEVATLECTGRVLARAQRSAGMQPTARRCSDFSAASFRRKACSS